MSAPSPDLLGRLLRDVSRSFYLTMRVLPGPIRPQISLAYLLARTTDTVADTAILPMQERLGALQQMRDRILGGRPVPVDLSPWVQARATDAERQLLERFEEALSLLTRLSEGDRQRIREVLGVITSGQELDLIRFARASRDRMVALSTDEEFDDYTYRVAGCVGGFWTRMLRTHLFPGASLDDEWFLSRGVRFGKGLQSVNILRDLASDLSQGRCYLPLVRLRGVGLSPEALLDPAQERKLRPAYDALLDQTQAHLAAGWEYTVRLPRGHARVRLACAWPILIGASTLSKLRTSNVLSVQHRAKVSRSELRRLVALSVILYPVPSAWRRLFSAAQDGRP